VGKRLEATLGVLNGLLGDYLVRTGNGLATEMAFHHDGRPITLDGPGFAAAHPQLTPRAVVLVHGVMCTEDVWRFPDGSDYGALLARDLGFTPFYLRYNSGLPIADSGELAARILEQLVTAYPVPLEELLLIGYSMGGLLIRRACHVADHEGLSWLPRVSRAIYVGTPHLGAPAERFGRSLMQLLAAIDDPYTRLVSEIGNLRSAGLQDLGHADLRHEDRTRVRPLFALGDPRHPLPLLPNIAHYLIAGSLAVDPRLAALFGDALVPVASATSGELLPARHVRVLPGLGHVALAHHPEVYAQIKTFCEEPR
jgi:pimeloyl-ACP methyl ester carboxylesterase